MLKNRPPWRWLVGSILVGLALAALFHWSLSIGPEATVSARAVRELQAAAPVDVKWNPAVGIPDWVDGPLPYRLSPAQRADPELASRAVLNHYRDIFGIRDADAEFRLVRIEGDALGQTHVRLQQVRNGVPVFARILLVHLGLAEGRVLGVNGDYQPGLDVATIPAVTAAQAEAQAVAASDGTSPAVYAPTELSIYVDDGTQRAYLTWRVHISTVRPAENLAYFVDAHGGGIVHRTPRSASDRYREVWDARLRDNLPGKFLAGEGSVPRDADGAAAYHNAGLVYDYWKNAFGRDSYDNNGGSILLVVHSPELGNSYWNGQYLVFGDKDDYVTHLNDAQVLDIMAHEFTHAVVQYTADLVYETQSGALNESFADVFAVMVDREDWHLFEDNSASPPLPVPWMRDMQDPSLGGNYDPKRPGDGWGQPARMQEYANLPNTRDGDWGGVHVNSGIPNHVLYRAATATSREATEQIWYRALSVYLTPKSDFRDFAKAIQKSADELYGPNSAERRAVDEALVAAGIITRSGGPGVQPTIVPTVRPQATIAPTPVPQVAAGCAELIANGTFEAARSEPWIERTTLSTPIIGTDFPRTGRRGAWLGGSDQESLQYIFQDIAIAANLTRVTITYWHYVVENTRPGAPDAVFEALVADPNTGDQIATLEEIPSSRADARWTQSTVDMSGYAGKKVRLAFTANMARGNTSNFFIDDVSVLGCTGPGPTTVTGGAAVRVTGTITDAGTGRAIEAAVFYVVRTSARAALSDGRLSADEVLAQGASDRKGNFKLDIALPRGQVYNVVVIATGYKTISADGAFDITAADPDPIHLDVMLQRR